jgi:hypothetical protein
MEIWLAWLSGHVFFSSFGFQVFTAATVAAVRTVRCSQRLKNGRTSVFLLSPMQFRGLPELRRLRNGRQIFQARNSRLEIRGPTSAARSERVQMACQTHRYRESAE